MKTIANTLALAAAAGMALIGVPTAAQSDNAATINKDFGCGFGVNTADGVVVAQGESPTRVVRTSSGNVTGFCNLDVVSGEVTKAFVLRDFGCTVGGDVAADTMITVSPGGKATLRCTVRKGKQ